MCPKSSSAALDDRTREQFLSELEELRARVAALEGCEARVEGLESTLRRGEELSRRFLDQTLIGVWVNVDDRVAFMNQLGAKILGASDPREIVGRPIFDIIHPDYHDIARERIQAMHDTQGAVPVIEEKLVGVDGRVVDVDLWAMHFLFEGRPAIFVGFHDITERKRAEESLKLTQFALDNFSDSAIWLTLDGRIVYVNQETCKSLGYSRDELLSMRIWDIDPDYSPEKFRELWRGAKQQGYTIKFESKHKARDGRVFPVEITACYTRYGDKEYLVTFDRDITEHKRIEREFRLTQFSVEKASDEIFWMGSDGRAAYVNDAACRVLGYSREELLSMYVWEWDPVFSPDRWRKYFIGLREKGFENFETLHRTRDGRVFPVEITADYIEYAGKEYSFAFVRDITERKKAEEALRESEVKFRRMAENIGEVLYTFSPDWKRTIYVSPAYERVWGRPLEDVYRDPMDWLEGVHPDDRGLPLAVVHRNVGGDFSWNDRVEYRVVRPDGSVRWIFARTFPVRSERGELTGITGIAEDITERKRAEEALRESRSMLESVMGNVPLGIFWKDRRSTYLGCNAVFARAVGLDSGEKIIGKTDFDLPWSRDQADAFREDDRRIMDNDAPDYHIVERQREADGRVAWVETNKVPLHDPRGKVIGLLGTYEDITDRKRAEEALRESEEKFRVLAETSPAAIFLYQGEKYVYVNSTAETLTGYSKDELLTGDAWEWIHPEFKELVKGRARKRQRGEQLPNRYEVMYRAKDGREGWVDFAAGPVEYGGKPAGLAMAFDVSKRKQTEEALRFERAQLLSIFDSIDEVVYVADPHTHEVLYANRAMRERFGKPLVGGLCYREIQNRDAPCEFCTNDIILEKKGEPYRWEFHNPIVNRDFDIVDRIIKWPDGRDVRFEVAIDITERKRTEEELKAARAQAELYVDLMGHDINNIHQAALGYMEMAKDMPGDSQDAYLDKAMEALNRSTRLINNVRKLQKLRDGRMQFRDVDVCAVLSEVHREYATTPGKNINLDLYCQAPCPVKADDLLHDVFSNLVGNAVKHTGNNTCVSISLNIVRENGLEYYRIYVDDNGPGIADESKGKLFKRSLKGTPRAKGMGLGLYIVKTLVENYDGRVWVEDRIKGDHSKGARFVVLLPAIT